MQHKKIIFLFLAVTSYFLRAQTLFSDRFSTYNLTTFNNGFKTTYYSNISVAYKLINDGRSNNTGPNYNPNAPFNVSSLKSRGWAVVKNTNENDTFLVSTSWFDTITNPASRWVISPAVNLTNNCVLSWQARSADASFPEKYEVYVTNKTGTLTANDFTSADKFFETATLNLNPEGGENPYWTNRAINLSSFSGQTIRFAFKNVSLNKYQIWIDDIKILQVANALDAAAIENSYSKFNLTSGSSSVSISVQNFGSTPINNCVINYKVSNSSIQSQTVNFSPPLTYLDTRSQQFTSLISLTTASLYPLKCWISNVNGQNDNNSNNDTVTSYISFQSLKPRKTVLVEQFVSAFDGQTPEAQNKLQNLQNDSVVVVNIHSNDSIKTSGLNTFINDYKKNTSTALIDRQYLSNLETYAVTPQNYQPQILNRISAVSPVSVSIINKTYNPVTRVLSFDVKADIVGSMYGDYRLNAYLTENLVTGFMPDTSLNGFNQVSGFYNVPWSIYYQKGYFNSQVNAHVLSSALYRHQNTLVHTFDNPYGITGTSTVAPMLSGSSITKTYTYTLPTNTISINKFIADNIYIVAYLAEYNNAQANYRTVINSAKVKLTTSSETLGVKEINEVNSISIYPNPSSGRIAINTKKDIKVIEVYNITGKLVYSFKSTYSNQNLNVDLSNFNNGVYFIKCMFETGSETKKIVLNQE